MASNILILVFFRGGVVFSVITFDLSIDVFLISF